MDSDSGELESLGGLDDVGIEDDFSGCVDDELLATVHELDSRSWGSSVSGLISFFS